MGLDWGSNSTNFYYSPCTEVGLSIRLATKSAINTHWYQCCIAQVDQVPSSLLVWGLSDLFAGSFLRVTTDII